MRYISIDIETTGLDHCVDTVLEIGLVDSLTGVSLTVLIWSDDDRYNCSPFIMDMHKDLFALLASAKEGALGRYKVEMPESTPTDRVMAGNKDAAQGVILSWLEAIGYGGKINVAGKNFYGFDYLFLRDLIPGVKMRRRALDPALLFVASGDDRLPGLALCLKRAGLPDKVTHRAVDDARQVLALLKEAGL